MLDSNALADLIAELVGEHVERATAPLLLRISELEAKATDKPGPEALSEAVAVAITEQLPIALANAKGEPGVGISDARLDEGRLVLALTDGSERDLGSVVGHPGKDGSDGAPGEPGVPGQDGSDGSDGKDAIGLADARILDDGQLALTMSDGSVKTLGPVIGKDGRDGIDGANGNDGADGRGLAAALIDRDGQLVLTMTDGSVKALGLVVGKDGRDGAPGSAGRDGFSLDDFDVTPFGDGRTVTLSFKRGDVTDQFELKFPVPIYRGVWREKDEAGNPLEHEPGDLVTWGGSLWHCDEKTDQKPDSGPWRLAVKKGRDGKDLAK